MTVKKRGFGSMDPAKQRAIASLGGKRAHELGTAHEFTPAEASAAGKKSRGHRFTSEEAAIAGRKGGYARSRRPPLAEDETDA